MNLAIDVGNTIIKLGVFDLSGLVLKKTCIKKDLSHTLNEIAAAFPNIIKAIVASVANISEIELSKLKKRYEVLVLNHQTKVPFTNNYSTPQTLGIDRVALVAAAADQYKNKNVLVIDAGTCITYDFISAQNEYLGGAISAGITMRYKALHTFTEKLPLLEANKPSKLIGDSTAASMHAGVVFGVLYEMDGFITSYKKKYNNLTIILTGGDAHFLRDSIKNDIFANSNFLLEGLNHILEYNTH